MQHEHLVIIPEEHMIRELAEKARANAIAACGLQPVIDSQIKRAAELARAEGYAAGKAAGREELYREMLQAKEDADEWEDEDELVIDDE